MEPEPYRVLGNILEPVLQGELCPFVNEPTDQPWRCYTIEVNMASCDPLHLELFL